MQCKVMQCRTSHCAPNSKYHNRFVRAEAVYTSEMFRYVSDMYQIFLEVCFFLFQGSLEGFAGFEGGQTAASNVKDTWLGPVAANVVALDTLAGRFRGFKAGKRQP